MAAKPVILLEEIEKGLREVGLSAGDQVIVHTSLGSMGYVCGGAQTVIEALLKIVGEDGTVMMPTQSWKNLDPLAGVHWETAETDWPKIRQFWPAYDKDITPTNTMGAVAEMFRRWPRSIRSDHPARSFAANGKNAKYLVENHDLCDIFGESSPIGKLYALGGKVLLIGVDYDKNTSLHLADVRADYPGKHTATESSAMLVNGERQWVSYETLYVDGEDFIEIGRAFEEAHPVKTAKIGNATVRCMDQRVVVDFAVTWIEKNRK